MSLLPSLLNVLWIVTSRLYNSLFQYIGVCNKGIVLWPKQSEEGWQICWFYIQSIILNLKSVSLIDCEQWAIQSLASTTRLIFSWPLRPAHHQRPAYYEVAAHPGRLIMSNLLSSMSAWSIFSVAGLSLHFDAKHMSTPNFLWIYWAISWKQECK